MFSSRVKWTKTMWTSSESYQPYDSNNIASKTITRCDAIEEESDSDKSPLILPSKEKVSWEYMLKQLLVSGIRIVIEFVSS